MNKEVKETIKILQNNSLVKSGSYEFIGDSDITYAEIYILLKFIEDLQQENKQLKELIDTILNWNIFKNECPMNFGYDEETNEDKAQDVFYKDDDYCENNCNDDYTKCWLKYFKRMQELEQGSDSNE